MRLGRCDRLLAALIVIALMVSVGVAAARALADNDARRVDIVVDLEQAATVAARHGLDLAELLGDVRDAGATALAVPARTLHQLALTGEVTVMGGHELADRLRLMGQEPRLTLLPRGAEPPLGVAGQEGPRLAEDWTYLLCDSGELAVRLAAELSLVLSSSRVHLVELGGHESIVACATTVENLSGMVLGLPTPPELPPGAPRFDIIPALANPPGDAALPGESLADALRNWPGVDTVLFTGPDVYGYPGGCHALGQALSRAGLAFAVERDNQARGVRELAAGAGYRGLRVFRGMVYHPSQSFGVAAKDRHVRLIYIRPFETAGTSQEIRAANLDLVRRAADGLRAAGFVPGHAVPVSDFRVPGWCLASAAAGVLAAAVWLCRQTIGWPRGLPAALGLPAVGGLAVLALGRVYLLREAPALMAAIIFPVLAGLLAVVILERLAADGSAADGSPDPAPATPRTGLGPRPVRLGPVWGRAAFLVATVTAVSVVGSLLLVCLLGDAAYALAVRSFQGVKLAYLVPPLLFAGLWAWDAMGRRRDGVIGGACAWLRRPVTVGLVCVVLVIGLAGLLYLGRSGHELGLPVFRPEIWLRTWLENLLGARPRTKEFGLGHPALFLAVYLAATGRRWAVRPLVLIGIVGQVSVVNSFCHLHTPLGLTLARTGYGLAGGFLTGAVLSLLALAVDRHLHARKEGVGPTCASKT